MMQRGVRLVDPTELDQEEVRLEKTELDQQEARSHGETLNGTRSLKRLTDTRLLKQSCKCLLMSLAFAVAAAVGCAICLSPVPLSAFLRRAFPHTERHMHPHEETDLQEKSWQSRAVNRSVSSSEKRFSIVRVKVAPGRQERYWDWTPLRLVQAGNSTVSLATSEGAYISVHMDGNLSAYARDVGPDEVFEEIPQHNDTIGGSIIALKSSLGKFLRVDQGGMLTADGDVAGSAETFTKVNAGDSAYLRHEGRVLAAVNTRLTFLTSSFVPPYANYHMREIYSAIIMNLQNEAIYDVHVMTETDCGLFRETIEHWAGQIANNTETRKAIHQKLVCVPSPTGVQPIYTDFFVYANVSLAGRIVLLANADIVFDDTLRRIAPEKIMSGEIAFVMSVSPPPTDGRYKEVFGMDCHPTVKCSPGTWQGAPSYRLAGWSWDAYIFGTPLPAKFNPSQANIVMNMMAAEFIAAYQFEASGVKLYNPCEHIHTYHWHCQGGKMHGHHSGVAHHAVANIFPCSYCPGITMPKGYAKREDLCRSGYEQWNNQIPHWFATPNIAVSICCKTQGACGSLYLPATPACVGPDDVDCIIWEFVGQHSTWVTYQ